MLKKVLTGTGIAAVLTTVFLLGSLFVGAVSAQSPDADPAVDETEVAEDDLDDVEDELEEEEENEDEDDIDDLDDVDDVDNQVEQDGEFEGEF